MRKILYPGVCVAALLASSIAGMGARQGGGNTVAIDADDIGGVVTSTKGPEAGVWVIAETKELPTGFSRIVVTDDRGRYVVPDLPKANYQVFVRGYGLVDSPKVHGRARQAAESEGGHRAQSARRRRVLSSELLAVAAQAAREERVPAPGAGSDRGTESG